jgi:cytoskeletal protein CcmA (bactofilin family)
MWKSGHTPPVVLNSVPEPIRFEAPAPTTEYGPRPIAAAVSQNQVTIGKGLVFKGSITGDGALFVDGEVVGNINLPGSRVTVGPTGNVSDGLSVCINAREIVIMGRIRGNICATDRVEIRAEGTLIGNVSAARIAIADGAFFKGDIDLRKAQVKQVNAETHEQERTRAYA